MTKIRALLPFVKRESNGSLTNVPCGSIVSVEDTDATALVNGGYAELYTLVEPTGSETITVNGTYDISTKASVVVNVGNVTLSYNANGGTGSVASVTVPAGNSVVLSDGTGLTAPEGKTFSGWGTSAGATETVESPYTVSADVTLYAVWVDA